MRSAEAAGRHQAFRAFAKPQTRPPAVESLAVKSASRPHLEGRVTTRVVHRQRNHRRIWMQLFFVQTFVSIHSFEHQPVGFSAGGSGGFSETVVPAA